MAYVLTFINGEFKPSEMRWPLQSDTELIAALYVFSFPNLGKL